MNVIRMIKVFGWERRIDEKIADKREEELVYQRKRVILEIISNVLKCVQPVWLWTMVLTRLKFLHSNHHYDRHLRLLCEPLRDFVYEVVFNFLCTDDCHEGRDDRRQGLLFYVR